MRKRKLEEQYLELKRLKETIDSNKVEGSGIIELYAKEVDAAFNRISLINRKIDKHYK